MNFTIYLPDKLGQRVKRTKMNGLGLSLICRKAIEAAFRRQDRAEKKRASA